KGIVLGALRNVAVAAAQRMAIRASSSTATASNRAHHPADFRRDPRVPHPAQVRASFHDGGRVGLMPEDRYSSGISRQLCGGSRESPDSAVVGRSMDTVTHLPPGAV